MQPWVLFVIFAVLAPVSPASAADVATTGPLRGDYPKSVVDLRYQDLEGWARKISDFKKKKALVVVFREATCPISEKLGPSLADIEKKYASRNIGFLFVYVGKVDPSKSARADRKKFGFRGEYTIDSDYDFVTALGGNTTTEVFVLDQRRRVVYRGAVHDQYDLGSTRPQIKKHFLESVLDDVIGARPVGQAATVAPGCILNHREPTVKDTRYTWAREVMPIIERRCMVCHQSEGSTPFSLETYEDVAGRRSMIEYVVRKGIMPPWGVDDSTGPFLNDLRLPASEKAVLSEWLLGGAPKGKGARARLSKKERSPWRLGKPDVVFPLPETPKIQKDGFMPYQYMRFKTGFTEERWVKSAEIVVHPRVVHHIVFNILENIDHKGDFWGLPGFSWTIGEQPEVFPDGTGMRIPAGAAIGVTIHYQPNGTEAVDTTTRLGLRFHKEPPDREVHHRPLNRGTKIRIPPGVADFHLQDRFVADESIVITGVSPHMHLRGRKAALRLVYPNGKRKDVFKLNNYNFNFQSVYTFKNPVSVPKGTAVECHLWYDNSEENPHNPDSSKTVTWGDQITDEMFLCNVQWYPEKKPSRR